MSGSGPHRPGRQDRGRAPLLALPALAFVVVLFVVPSLAVARVSVAGSGQPGSRSFSDLSVLLPSNLATLAGDRLFVPVLGVTARLGLLVAAICLCVAVPYASYIHRSSGWRRWA